MNNGCTDLMAEHDYNMDKFFADNKSGSWAMIVGDLSYMEGYIKGLEAANKMLQEQLIAEIKRNE